MVLQGRNTAMTAAVAGGVVVGSGGAVAGNAFFKIKFSDIIPT